MKTKVYVDGFNFYYSCLKRTAYKWLDLHTLLADHLIPRSGASNETHIVEIKYFTAKILPKVARDESSEKDQVDYHRALQTHRKTEISFHEGYYSVVKSKAFLYEEGKDPKDSEKVDVWDIEEKQSDVSMAVNAVFDATTDPELDQIILVTNDTDLVPAIDKVKKFNSLGNRKKPVVIGVITPIRDSKSKDRPFNKNLTNTSDWYIPFIKESELSESQLPTIVDRRKRPAIKPAGWFKHPEFVKTILEDLSAQLGYVKSWRFLTAEPLSAKQLIDGLEPLSKPIADLLDDESSHDLIRRHITEYVDYLKIKSQR